MLRPVPSVVSHPTPVARLVRQATALCASAALLLLENAARRRQEQRGRDALKRRYLARGHLPAAAGSGVAAGS